MQTWERLEPIRLLEKQSELSRLLIFLYIEVSHNISYTIDASNIQPNSAYAAVRKATDLKLITSDYGEESNFRIRKLALTEKGIKIAKLLNDVNDLLSK